MWKIEEVTTCKCKNYSDIYIPALHCFFMSSYLLCKILLRGFLFFSVYLNEESQLDVVVLCLCTKCHPMTVWMIEHRILEHYDTLAYARYII